MLKVIVIIVGNEFGNLSSNPECGRTSFRVNNFQKGMNPSIMSKL